MIFNIVLFFLAVIIVIRVASSIKNKKRRIRESVVKAWSNGEKKANALYRKDGQAAVNEQIKSNILLSIAVKNKEGSKSESFELAYITLAETVSMSYYIERINNPNLPYYYDDNVIDDYVRKEVFTIFRNNEKLEKSFRKSLNQETIPEEHKEDVYKILVFLTEISKFLKQK